MASLSLRVRRLRARGLNRREAAAWGRRNFIGLGNRASLTLGTGNAKVMYIAKTPGTGGNAITIRYVVGGLNTPLTVTVAGTAITVNLATNGAGAATSIAVDVRKAVNFSTTAGPLVWAETAIPGGGSDGTGVVAATAATNLAGAV